MKAPFLHRLARSLTGAALLAAATFGAHASSYDLPVREVPVPGLNDFAIASYDPAGPVIYYNPTMAALAGPAVSAFVRAHEYAHIRLGHLDAQRFVSNPYLHLTLAQSSELAADKFAAEFWARHNPAVVRAAIEFFSSPLTGNF